MESLKNHSLVPHTSWLLTSVFVSERDELCAEY